MTDHTHDTLESLLAEFVDNHGGGDNLELDVLIVELREFIQRKREVMAEMCRKWHKEAHETESGYAMAEDCCKLTRHIEGMILGRTLKENDDDYDSK